MLVGFNLLLPVSVICLRLLHRSTKTPFKIVLRLSEYFTWFCFAVGISRFFCNLLSGFVSNDVKLKRENVASVVGLCLPVRGQKGGLKRVMSFDLQTVRLEGNENLRAI